MTLEEFLKALQENAEFKTKTIEVLTASGEIMSKSDFEGLKTNRDIILGEKKEIQKKIDSFNEERENLQKELDKMKKALNDKGKDSDNPEIAVLKSQIESLEGKLSESQTQVQTLVTEKHDTILTGFIKDKMDELKIAPHFKKILTTDFKSKAELKTVDGKQYIMFDGKPESDFFNEWAKSEDSKHFILSSDNGGGGSQGGSGSSKNEKFDLKEYLSGQK